MAWQNKFSEIISDSQSNLKLRIVFRHFPPVDSICIANLRQAFPLIPDEYCELLSITDGASLWMYELYGSGLSEMFALKDLHSRWQPLLTSLRVFPFAEDPSGNCIAIRETGEIVMIDFHVETYADCIQISPSFDTFIDQMLMGENFYSLIGLDPSNSENNEWVEYLFSKGWIDKLN
jgi:hypothetical protein